MSLEELQSQVKRLIGDIISKPKMSDKLLTKPPFRFLHDTISGVCKATGFASGLYSDDMLDSSAITDKAGKINYLELIFNCVSIVKGYPIDIRAAKVVAGLEPENTNTFLIAFAEVATDRNTDSNQAVQRTLSGETPGSGPPAVRGSGGGESKAESKGSPMSSSGADDAKDRGGGSKSDSKSPGGGEMTGPPAGFGVDVENLERGKSRSGTRGSKPNRETGAAAAGLSGFSNLPPNLDDDINACDGDVETTKRLVGALISRPKLSDKLLSKPPFRFLHDLVMEMIRTTNFATNLYDPEEADSSQVTDKEKKMGFLDKIIKVVGISLNTIVEARSAKIVAGLEPQNTNVFLQLFAVAAKNISDSYESVKSVREQFGQSMPERSMGGASGGSGSGSGSLQADIGRERTEYRAESKNDSHMGGGMGGGGDVTGNDDKNANNNNNNNSSSGSTEQESGPKSLRPTTARRRPPKVKDGAREMTAKDTAPTTKKTEGIMIDGAQDDEDIEDDELVMADQKRLGLNMSDANTNVDSKTAESKLVQDIMARQAESDAAETVDDKEEAPDTGNKKDPEEVQGSGIRLGARLGRKSVRKSSSRDRDSGAKGGGSATPSVGSGSTHTPQDINRLRSAIQVLVQHTGPLGTCMDFIQEDVGLMSAELHRWEDECRKYEAEVEMEKKKSEDLLRPLSLELKDLDDQVNESISKISALKAQIARNENKVQQILKLVATS